MGLDFSHCSAMWSYSGFNEFRERLLEESGYSWTDVTARKANDPLHVLLDHSDCEGFIEIADCRPLAERLYSIVDKWPPDDHDRMSAMQLVKGLRLASERNQRLEFR